MVIEDIVADNTWIGVTDKLGITKAMLDKEPHWWIPPNCVTGCERVQVVVHKVDGTILYLPEFTRQS